MGAQEDYQAWLDKMERTNLEVTEYDIWTNTQPYAEDLGIPPARPEPDHEPMKPTDED